MDNQELFRVVFYLPGLEPRCYLWRPVSDMGTPLSTRAIVESGILDAQIARATADLKGALRSLGYQLKGAAPAAGGGE